VILATDIGNSNLKCAVVDRNGVLGRESLPLRRCRDATAVADMIRRVSNTVLSIDDALICSVVPPFNGLVAAAIRRQLGRAPRLVDYTYRFPFDLNVPVPSQVGADRLCAAAGALGAARRNGIVIDAGSAITVELIRDGAYLGGIIAAGPSLALRALNRYASKLPAIAYANLGIPFPRTFDTTEPAMILGASLGAVGVIRESVRYLESAVGAAPPKYLTGGFAHVLRGRLPRSWDFDPDLVLKGMYVVAGLNTTVEAD
jgi:type III pantothenate kinase